MSERQIKLIYKASEQVRGVILERLSEFEFWIDVYITRIFTNDIEKEDEFMSLIIAPNVTFRNKIEIFKVLVNKYHPNFRKKHTKFWKDFLEIVEKRNMLAHLRVDTRPEAVAKYKEETVISYIRFKNSTEKINGVETVKFISFNSFSETYVNGLIKLIDIYSNSIKSLIDI
jgi:hypothetical protein